VEVAALSLEVAAVLLGLGLRSHDADDHRPDSESALATLAADLGTDALVSRGVVAGARAVAAEERQRRAREGADVVPVNRR